MTGIPFLRCFLFVFLEQKEKFLNSKVSTGIAWSQRSRLKASTVPAEQSVPKKGVRPKARQVLSERISP